MPLKSKAQLRRFGELVEQGKMSSEEFKKWREETPNIDKLPERLTPKKPTGVGRLRETAKTKVIK